MAITPSHEAEVYAKLILLLVKATKGQWRPTMVMSDFEMAIAEGVRRHFPEARMVGCYFHFKQAVLQWLKHIRFLFFEVNLFDLVNIIKLVKKNRSKFFLIFKN